MEIKTPKYSMTLKITKPDKMNRREVYGEVSISGNDDKEFVDGIKFAMNEFMKQIN
jgi:hypothetical protein